MEKPANVLTATDRRKPCVRRQQFSFWRSQPVFGFGEGGSKLFSMNVINSSQESKRRSLVSVRMSLNKRCREGSFWRSSWYRLGTTKRSSI